MTLIILINTITKYAARLPGVRSVHSVLTSRTLDAENLLLGRENELNPNGFSQVTGNLLWTSTRLKDSPHVQFLTQFASIGEAVFDRETLEKTRYYRNAIRSIELFGRYYEAKTKEGVVEKMNRYAEQLLLNQKAPQGPNRRKFTVRPIRESSLYQILDNHHDMALAYALGRRGFRVHVGRSSTQTALQELLSRVLWFDGNRELYQPIDAPEIKGSWTLIRKCSDRFLKMQGFLNQMGISSRASYVDIGSFYGWFVHNMTQLGYNSHGVELDPIAASVGVGCYGISPEQISVKDATTWLRESPKTFDVVSCFSVLHHFVYGSQQVSAEEFIRLVANTTNQVFFMDTGEEHESWFQGKLTGWTPDYIEKWVLTHTNFKRAYRLGTDEDARFPHHKNYGRMLFAFVR